MLAQLWNLQVIIPIVGLIIAAGGGAVMVTPPDYMVAKICWSVAVLAVLPSLAHWIISTPASVGERILFSFLVFGALGATWAGAIFWVQDREKQSTALPSMPTVETRTEVPTTAPPITLTLRFNPKVEFPFTIPPQTTAYAVLADPNNREQLRGVWDISNAGEETVSWPRNDSLERDQFTSLPDLALTLDLLNFSPTELINVHVNMDFEFFETIKDETSSHSGASIGGITQGVNIPVIPPKSTVKIFVANQSVKYYVHVSFPTEAKVLVSGESARRTINIIRTGVSFVGALPGFPLSPAKVKWRGFGQRD